MVTAVSEVKLTPRCFFCNCVVGEEHFCYGCGEFVCEICNEVECVGEHEVKDHRINWQEVDEDD